MIHNSHSAADDDEYTVDQQLVSNFSIPSLDKDNSDNDHHKHVFRSFSEEVGLLVFGVV